MNNPIKDLSDSLKYRELESRISRLESRIGVLENKTFGDSMPSAKDAIKAANIIAQFCKTQHMNCYDCPFGSDCVFKLCPSGWKLDRVKLKQRESGL